MVVQQNPVGAWIFLSHSHKDIEKVREIRNELETNGHNPLMFFLKCMEDDDQLLPQLIKNEISARNWFILCESNNSRSSKWVQDEVSIIKSYPDKIYVVIDLEKNLSRQKQKIISISKRTTIFISYAFADRRIAQAVYNYLLKEDFRIFFDIASLSAGELWSERIEIAITEAVKDGFVIILVSKNYLYSQYTQSELSRIFEAVTTHRNNIIFLFIEELLYTDIPDQLRSVQSIRISETNFENQMRGLVLVLKRIEMD